MVPYKMHKNFIHVSLFLSSQEGSKNASLCTFAFVAPKKNQMAFSQNSSQMQVTKKFSSFLPRLLDSTTTCKRAKQIPDKTFYKKNPKKDSFIVTAQCICWKRCSVLPSRGQLIYLAEKTTNYYTTRQGRYLS